MSEEIKPTETAPETTPAPEPATEVPVAPEAPTTTPEPTPATA